MRGRVSYAAIIRSEAIHRHPQKKEWIASTASVLAMTEKNSSAINSIARPANSDSIFQKPCQAPNKKIFRFSRNANRAISTAIPSRPEGRSRSSRTWDGDAVDAKAATDERGLSVRQRRVVLTSRCWRQRTWRQQLLRAQRRQKSRSPGRARYKP